MPPPSPSSEGRPPSREAARGRRRQPLSRRPTRRGRRPRPRLACARSTARGRGRRPAWPWRVGDLRQVRHRRRRGHRRGRDPAGAPAARDRGGRPARPIAPRWRTCSAEPRRATSRSWSATPTADPSSSATPPCWTTARRCRPASGWSATPSGLAIGRLEAAGGVHRAEAEVDPGELAAAHAATPPSGTRPARRTTTGPGRPAASAAPGRGSSACTPTTPGSWPAATTPSVAGSARAPGRGRKASHDATVAAIDCGTNSTRLLIADDGRTARAAHAHHPPRPGRRRHRPARPRGHRADDGGAARVPARPWTGTVSSGCA